MNEFKSIWAPYLKEFLEYKRLSGYKYDKGYKILKQFDKHYNEMQINGLVLSKTVIESFLYLKGDRKITTKQRKASVIRQFCDFALRNNIIDEYYKVPVISSRGSEIFIPHIFSKQELSLIVEYMNNYSMLDVKKVSRTGCNTINAVSTIFKILISTGMRIGEVLHLKYKDIDFNNELFVVLEAKNDNQRLIPFSKTIKNEVINYIINTPFQIDKDDHLFKSNTNSVVNRELCYYYFRKSIDYISKKYPIYKKARIHDFRHTYAVMALTQLQQTEGNVNLSLTYLSDYLGHKSLKETQKYLWLTPSLFEETKNQMNSYTSFIKEIYDGEKYDD